MKTKFNRISVPNGCLDDDVRFPIDRAQLAKLEVVQNLGGSTGAILLKDSTDALFVLKRGNSPEHLRNECQADAFYRALGIKAPVFKLFDDERDPVKLSRFLVDAISLNTWFRKASQSEIFAMQSQLRAGFAIDVLIGNWDVVGLNADNIMIDKHGAAWRVDNGGALAYRAQGVKKLPNQWGADALVDDLWTMTNSGLKIGLNIRSSIPFYFGRTDVWEIANEIKSMAESWQSKSANPLDVLSSNNRAIVELRLALIRMLVDRGADFFKRYPRNSYESQKAFEALDSFYINLRTSNANPNNNFSQ